MVATYNPVVTPRDELRFRAGDVDVPNNAILQDGEYDYCLTQTGGNIQRALAMALWAIARKYAHDADTTEGDVSVKAGAQAAHYRRLAMDADVDAASADPGQSPVPFGGGLSKSDVDAREADTDRVQSAFGSRRGNDAALYGRW